jgi:4-hydroxy-4-methyl-2-oxoglutarate aldolase
MPADQSGVARHGLSAADLDNLSVALAADALDGVGARQQVMAGSIQPLQPGVRLVGWAHTIEVRATDVVLEEPYTGEMAALDALQPGDVAVYHLDTAVEAALFGELFGLAAQSQGAVGAVLDGPVRDVRQLREQGFPVFANGVSPYDTRGRAEVVAHGKPVVCGGVAVAPGDLIVADDDGIIVVPGKHVAAVVDAVLAKATGERGAYADLLAGMKVHEVWEKWRVF